MDNTCTGNTCMESTRSGRKPMKRALEAMLFAACLFASGLLPAQDHAFDWNPRSGDAWIDRQLADINIYGARYRGAFIDEVVRYHAAPRDLVAELVGKRNWAPGDVYYACAVAKIVGRPCRALVDAWSESHGEGWAEVASLAGIDGHRDAVARLKQEITDSYARWGRPLAKAEAAPATEAGAASADKPAGRKKAAKKQPAKPRP